MAWVEWIGGWMDGWMQRLTQKNARGGGDWSKHFPYFIRFGVRYEFVCFRSIGKRLRKRVGRSVFVRYRNKLLHTTPCPRYSGESVSVCTQATIFQSGSNAAYRMNESRSRCISGSRTRYDRISAFAKKIVVSPRSCIENSTFSSMLHTFLMRF